MKPILLLALAASAPNQQFNLVCAGTFTRESVDLGKKVEPYRFVYRFDLAANKWCDGECKGTRGILRVGPTQITLTDENTDTPREKKYRSEFIDRETGRHSTMMTTNSRMLGFYVLRWEGHCDPAPFSGFPTGKVKF